MQRILGVRNPILFFSLKPYVVATSMLSVVLAGVTIGITSMEQGIILSPNPFSAYIDRFPGQPDSAAQVGATSCESVYTNRDTPAQESCTFTPTGGVFSSVEVVFSRGTIRQVTFEVRHNALQIGDLEIYFGQSATFVNSQIDYFYLPDKFAVVQTVEGRFSRFLMVKSVSFYSTSYVNMN